MPRSGTLTASKVLLQAYVRGSTIGQVRPMRNPRSSDLSNSSPRSHGGPEVGPQWGCTLPLVRAAAVFPCPGSEWRRIAWPNEVFKEPIHSGLELHASGMGMAIADRRGDLAWLAKARGVTPMKDRQGRRPRSERFPSCEQNLRLRQHRESSLHLGALRVYLRIRVCRQAKPQTPYCGNPSTRTWRGERFLVARTPSTTRPTWATKPSFGDPQWGVRRVSPSKPLVILPAGVDLFRGDPVMGWAGLFKHGPEAAGKSRLPDPRVSIGAR